MTAMVKMEPALRGTLAKELLHLVFSRLSVAEISGLRLRSKGWKRDIDTSDSEFNRVLEATVYPNMFGFIVQRMDFEDALKEEYYGRILDVKSQRWHALGVPEVTEGYEPQTDIIMVAADGGLVCFVLECRLHVLCFIVMNPLTSKKKTLPRLRRCKIGGEEPTLLSMMVQLTLDRQTQQYKVFVVGYKKKAVPYQCAQVYDSKFKRWTIVGSREQSWDRIFGCEYFRSGREIEIRGPCVYDFAEGLQYFGSDSIVPSDGRSEPPPYALLDNCLFVLCGDRSPGRPIGYYISEYVLQKNATAWVKVQDIRNFPFEHASKDPFSEDSEDSDSEYYNFTVHDFNLHACNGLLTLFEKHFPMGFSYDLSTCQGQKLPKILSADVNEMGSLWVAGDSDADDGGDRGDRGHSPMDLMCKFSWDAKQ